MSSRKQSVGYQPCLFAWPFVTAGIIKHTVFTSPMRADAEETPEISNPCGPFVRK